MIQNKIAIYSFSGDYHAAAVEWALECLGAQVQLWDSSLFTDRQTNSVLIRTNQDIKLLKNDKNKTDLNNIDTVWYRRNSTPNLHPQIDDPYPDYSQYEIKEMLEGIRYASSQISNWINCPISTRTMNNKIYQINTENKLGFSILDILITNDPEEIKEFYLYHKGKIIFKPFRTRMFADRDKGAVVGSYTRIMDAKYLENPISLQALPIIYQELITKIFEVRVFFFG